MYNLNEFIEKKDEDLQSTSSGSVPIDEPPKTNNPTVDFFNSAGNTKLEDEQEPTTETREPLKGRIVLGKLISGKSAVALINIFIPSFIVFSLHRFGYNSTKPQFKLTTEEKEIMNPIVQDCLDYIVINFDNPFYALAFVASMIYGSKILDVVPELKRLKEDTDETIEEQETQYSMPYKAPYNPPEWDKQKPKQQYTEARKQIESTTLRKEKNRIIIDTIQQSNPTDLIEMSKIYCGIFPERTEGYFRTWYEKNYELFPENLRFNAGNDSIVTL